MPELPEVETIVRQLNIRALKVLGARFVDAWTDAKSIIKKNTWEDFKKGLIGKRIIKVRRRAKNIIFELSGNHILLIHQKMTGHLLLGEWTQEGSHWAPNIRGPLDDPMNRFLHLIFCLDNKKMLALSDVRKFAKVELWDKVKFLNFILFMKILDLFRKGQENNNKN